ncbi:MAG: alanine racemase [Pseudomonadota bacterium]
MRRSAYALIRLERLTHNLKTLRSFTKDSKVISVVKAEAYGHGLAECAQALNQSDAFAVACASEAMELRATGILHPILCLQGFQDEKDLQLIAESNTQPVIHSDHQISLLKKYPHKQSIQVWLKIDTGMGRLGFPVEKALRAYQQLSELKCINKIRIMTHFSHADLLNDEITQRQLQRFESTCKQLPDTERSAANSAAAIAYSNSHYQWVRPGLSLYGVSPFQDNQCHPDITELKPVMSVHAPIISIKQCKQGDQIGYGGHFTCPQDMRVGVVAIGYADGYPRTISQPLDVSVSGSHAPVIGRVSMDMITINLEHVDAEIGDDVELWGDDIPVNEVARAADTISYELLCGITGRLHRIYE